MGSGRFPGRVLAGLRLDSRSVLGVFWVGSGWVLGRFQPGFRWVPVGVLLGSWMFLLLFLMGSWWVLGRNSLL